MAIDNPKLASLITQGKESPFYPELQERVQAVCHSLGFQDQKAIVSTLERLWLLLALDLATETGKLPRTFIQGILGGQGTGKTTLSTIICLLLKELGFSTASLSIDDLYLTYAERQSLKQEESLKNKNPMLDRRGPPGTHDFKRGIEILKQCWQEDNLAEIALPRFDKSKFAGEGDRIEPEIVPKPDILLFEGWFVGAQPIDPSCFEHPPEPIITEGDQQFAQECNQRLQNNYLPLWQKLDSLIVLYPEDYHLSKQWRYEAEVKMIAQKGSGMSKAECDRFVEYFWKALHPELFITPLTKTADWVVEINSDHGLGNIYRNR